MLFLRWALATSIVMLAALQTPPPGTPPDEASTRVETSLGLVQGYAENGVEYFLGVPYASPPEGALRWKPPVNPRPWEGVLDATDYGDTCAAGRSPLNERSESEDCLFLNIQRPAGTTTEDRLPVYVFIHGGGFVSGHSNQMDGAAIATMNNVITVSINYRLGLFGFFAHPGLTAEAGGSSGNYGIMDQQAALRWIQSHITSFGGDPGRVTIGGESAGGASVCAHLASPASAGLFHQAMMQSAFCWVEPLTVAEAKGEDTASWLGCDGTQVVSCLRDLPVADLVDYPIRGVIPPVYGAGILPEDPNLMVAEARTHPVPIVVGWNRDEGRLFGLGYIGMNEDDYTETVNENYGDRADEFKALYPWPDGNSAAFTGVLVLGPAISDQFACDSLNLADQLDMASPAVYVYVFSHQYGPGLYPGILPNYNWGAAHGAELPYLFPSFGIGTPLAAGFDRDEQVLARQMKAQWGQFIATGSPNGEGLLSWMPYSDSGTVMALHAGNNSIPVGAEALRERHHCSFWDTIEGTPGAPFDSDANYGRSPVAVGNLTASRRAVVM